jgi:hypothetical protein
MLYRLFIGLKENDELDVLDVSETDTTPEQTYQQCAIFELAVSVDNDHLFG